MSGVDPDGASGAAVLPPESAGEDPGTGEAPGNRGPRALEIVVAPNRMVRGLRLAVLNLGILGFLMAGWLSWGHDEGWALLGLGALMLWAGWRHSSLGLAWGTLFVAEDGRPTWRPVGGAAGPVSVERWFTSENLAWVRLRGPSRERYEVLLARSSLDEDSWRGVTAWLAWLRRARGG